MKPIAPAACFLITAGFYFFLSISNLNAQEAEELKADIDRTGMILTIGAFDYLSVGIGINKGNPFKANSVFSGFNYGAVAEYKMPRELHIRGYANIYGGFIGLYLGASVIGATDFETVTGGVAPEAGLGLPGFSVLYRYNFYFYRGDRFNCHEIALQVYPVFKKSGGE